ncbi:MAG: MinD/ParA family protein [Pseudomonadota bacterium]
MSMTRVHKPDSPIAEPPAHPARVVAVASGKGGVGKSNISVNLAVALAQQKKSVMVMDADLGLANIDVLLGLRPQYDLYHVITGQKTLEEIIIEGPHGIGIVPATSGVKRMTELAMTEHAGLIHAFDALNRAVEVLIIDTAAGIADSVVVFCKAAQEVIVVVCDEPASITDAYALIKVLHLDHKVKRFQVLCNQVQNSAHGRQLYAKLAKVADTYLDVSLGYLGCVPHDEKLKQAVKLQKPVVDAFPHSASAIAFKGLADSLLALPPASGNGFLEFFAGQLSTVKAVAGKQPASKQSLAAVGGA